MVSVQSQSVPTIPQWLFSPEALLHTPSRADGIEPFNELQARRDACAFAADLAWRFWPPPNETHGLVGGAAAFIHRFYMRASVRFCVPRADSASASRLPAHLTVGACCLILAGKDTERTVPIVQLAAFLLSKESEQLSGVGFYPAQPGEQAVQERVNELLQLEELIAHTLCWQFLPGLPYEPFTVGVRRMYASEPQKTVRDMFTFLQAGWAFINDSLWLPLVVLQPPTVIAASVYVVTQTALGHTLEDTLDSFDDWKGHFGIKDDADYNPKEEPKFEAVEECLAWFSNYAGSTRQRPELEGYRKRLPKPWFTP